MTEVTKSGKFNVGGSIANGPVTEPVDLDALERRLDLQEQRGGMTLDNTECRKLIAAARRLRELESALEFTAKATLNHTANDKGFPTFAEALLDTARELGWDTKAKDGV